MENIGSGRDRIGAEEQRKAGLLRRSHETHCQSLISTEVAIHAGSELGGRDLIADLESFRRFAKVIARTHRHLVGFDQQGLGLELVLDPLVGQVHGAVI